MERLKSKAELIERIDNSWQALSQALESLSVGELETKRAGEWAIKDHVAHLTAWQQYMLRHHIGGEPAGAAMDLDAPNIEKLSIDQRNELLYQRDRERPAGELLAELRASYADVRATLEQISYDDLLQPRYPEHPAEGPLLLWVAGDTYEHFQEHLEAIQGARGT